MPTVQQESPGHGVLTGMARNAALLLVTGLVLFGALLAAGWWLVHVEPGTAVGAADVGVVAWLAAHRVPELDTLSGYASDLVSLRAVEIGGPLAAVAAAALLRRWWPLIFLVVAVAGQLVIFLNSAILVGRPRPPVPHVDAALPQTSSFPSGHTAAAICLFGGLAIILLQAVRAWWRWVGPAVAAAVVLAVMWSRLYRGAHHPTDVLAAAAFAVPWLLVSARACRPGALARRAARPAGVVIVASGRGPRRGRPS